MSQTITCNSGMISVGFDKVKAPAAMNRMWSVWKWRTRIMTMLTFKESKKNKESTTKSTSEERWRKQKTETNNDDQELKRSGLIILLNRLFQGNKRKIPPHTIKKALLYWRQFKQLTDIRPILVDTLVPSIKDKSSFWTPRFFPLNSWVSFGSTSLSTSSINTMPLCSAAVRAAATISSSFICSEEHKEETRTANAQMQQFVCVRLLTISEAKCSSNKGKASATLKRETETLSACESRNISVTFSLYLPSSRRLAASVVTQSELRHEILLRTCYGNWNGCDATAWTERRSAT